jgi:signal transduction histidine kinase
VSPRARSISQQGGEDPPVLAAELAQQPGGERSERAAGSAAAQDELRRVRVVLGQEGEQPRTHVGLDPRLPALLRRAQALAQSGGQAEQRQQRRDRHQRASEEGHELVSNAIKFTPEGGFVEVRVRHGAETTVLEVQDSGIGIPEGEQGRLFERFFRASSVGSRVPGVGLGLTIVKAIVEGHGGTLEVSSKEGAGTTCRVELPNAMPAAGIVAPDAALHPAGL